MAQDDGKRGGKPVADTTAFEDVLRAEWSEISKGRAELRQLENGAEAERGNGAGTDAPPPNLTGLAFSGGGIRSATFNLGVIQALAELRLLRKFDYLSTVSGGGYIGSWLSSWMAPHGQGDEDAADTPGNSKTFRGRFARFLGSSPDQDRKYKSIVTVEKALAPDVNGEPAVAAGDAEPHPLRHLRSYTDYLKPRGGFFSLDAITAFTTWLRNALLNQLILIVVFACLLLLPLGAGWLVMFAHWSFEQALRDHRGLWYAACACVAVAVCFINLNLMFQPPARRVDQAGAAGAHPEKQDLPWYSSLSAILATIVAPLTLASCLVSLILPSLGSAVDGAGGLSNYFSRQGGLDFLWMLGMLCAACLVTFAASILFQGLLIAGDKAGRRDSSIIVYAPVFGAVAILNLMLLPVVATFLDAPDVNAKADIAVLVSALSFTPPLILTTFALSVFAYVGLIGREFDEHQREWWSRLIALLSFAAAGWLALFGVSFWGPVMVEWLKLGLAAAVAWFGASGLGAFAGKSAATGRGAGEGGSKWLDLAARAVPYIFIPGLCLVVAYWLNASLLGFLTPGPAGPPAPAAQGLRDIYLARIAELDLIFRQPGGRLAIEFAVLIFVGVVLIWRVDINVFSFHSFYRNRLARAYLAAALPVQDRDELPLTGMNDRDSPRLVNLPSRPYHLLNTSLNITSGKHLSWQERKAASFFFSKKYCGYYLPGEASDDNYCETRDYVRNLPWRSAWISLSLPMTISGAAASPNAGYHTSPPLAFLMTVFNVRLGWWMQNTSRQKYWRSPGPLFSLNYLLKELVANVDEDSKFVYLSDGGHFENLGIYELVRRRCRFILACDAGADPDFQFEDLGNAIRKCDIDLGVRIDIDVENIRPAKEGGHKGRSRQQSAIGFIYYPKTAQADRTPRSAADYDLGVLLYVKSSMGDVEPTDVEQYKSAHPDFPHDPTSNQFFTESQFESYRKLGYGLCRRALASLETAKTRSVQQPAQEAPAFAARDRNFRSIVDAALGGEIKVTEKPWTHFAGKVQAAK